MLAFGHMYNVVRANSGSLHALRLPCLNWLWQSRHGERLMRALQVLQQARRAQAMQRQMMLRQAQVRRDLPVPAPSLLQGSKPSVLEAVCPCLLDLSVLPTLHLLLLCWVCASPQLFYTPR